MKIRFPHSQEDVRAIQDSYRRYLTCIHAAISPNGLLQAANSQRREVFQVFFEALEEHKADLEPHKSYLRGKVPPHYQQDLEQACALSAGAVAMETSTSPIVKQVPGTQQPHCRTVHECIVLRSVCLVCSCHPLHLYNVLGGLVSRSLVSIGHFTMHQ